MANHKSALKRNRQNQKKRVQNRSWKKNMRTQVKAARAEIQAGGASPTKGQVLDAVKQLASAGSKGILHKKTAARRVSRLMRAAARSAKTEG